jgi:hypothetical protein
MANFMPVSQIVAIIEPHHKQVAKDRKSLDIHIVEPSCKATDTQ